MSTTPNDDNDAAGNVASRSDEDHGNSNPNANGDGSDAHASEGEDLDLPSPLVPQGSKSVSFTPDTPLQIGRRSPISPGSAPGSSPLSRASSHMSFTSPQFELDEIDDNGPFDEAE